MKCISKARPGPGAQLLRVAPPSIGANDVLLKVRRASICGSDMNLYHWTGWAPGRVKTPLVFGHEFCGTVVELGPRARGLSKGDFVSVESHVYCGGCIPCRAGQRHVCQNLKIIGIDRQGGFAQYAAVPARCAWKHVDGALQDVGSLMEPLGNAVYAALCEEVRGLSVLVLGCGPQGLFAVAAAKASGAEKVIAVEGSVYRQRLAERMGADAVIDPAATDVLSRIREAAGRRWAGGVDAVLEMSGAPAAVELGLAAARNGGRLTAFGLPSGPLGVHWGRDIVFKGIRIHGIAGREIFKTWELMDRLLRTRAIDVRPVITHVFPLRDFQKGFETMASPDKRCGKVVFEVG